MKILHLYFSATGNTSKVAQQIDKTLAQLGHEVETRQVIKETEADFLAYDLIFMGSGVYSWLPGKPMLEFIGRLLGKYVQAGEIKPASHRRPGKKAVIYCTFGGGHTGANEAVPAIKYMGQLFDHLGYEIVADWYVPGEFIGGNLQHLSTTGRLGNIQGRPNNHDLQEISEKVIGILRV